MRNTLILLLSLVVVCSCSPERTFQAGPSPRLTPPGGLEQTSRTTRVPAGDPAREVPQEDLSTRESTNTPPELTSVKLAPEVFHVGDTLGIEASASDKDGDEVSILYEWFLNEEAAGQTNRLAVPVRRGDKLRVRVTPFDGKEEGRSAVLTREVMNMPPMFTPVKEGIFDGETYRCQVEAEDPDGDAVTYALKGAPEGMMISAATGLMTWKVPPDFTGAEGISVVARDGHGGEAEYRLHLTFREEEPSG